MKDKKYSELGKRSWEARKAKKDMVSFMASISRSGVEAKRKKRKLFSGQFS